MPANSSVTRSRRFLILGGYGALTLAFLVVGVIPYFRGMSTANAAIARSRQEIAENIQKKTKLTNVEKEIELVRRQVASFPQLVPEKQELGAFLDRLSKKLDEAGMKDIANKALASISMGRTQKLPIELRGTGSFTQFHKFLVQLEGMERKCSVGRLQVEADTEMTGNVNVELLLYIYNAKSGT